MGWQRVAEIVAAILIAEAIIRLGLTLGRRAGLRVGTVHLSAESLDALA
jgi:hypothetical protein